ncbi:MAG: T9SS type A sorting domain-containing protein, partial [bacterium]
PRTYTDLNVGNFVYTITNFGYSGYFDPTVNSPQGNGFRYPRSSTSSYMFGGEFLLGLDYNNVITGEYGTSSEWIPTSAITVLTPGSFADQELHYSFVDPVSMIGVNSVAYAWSSHPRNDFAILEFTLTNISSNTYSNIYTGYYIDWDIDYDSSTQSWYDKGAYVGANVWAYMYDSKTPPVLPAYVGLVGLTSGARGSMVDNAIHVYPDSMGWADSVKYNFMAGRFNISNASTPKDWSMIIANGPFTLPPNSTFKVAYAVVAGDNLSDFQSNASQARTTYGIMTSITEKNVVESFYVSYAYPNPFNSKTAIEIDSKRDDIVQVNIYDILGRSVYGGSKRISAGKNRFVWDGKDYYGNELPSGVYLIKLKSGNLVQERKAVIIR